MAADGIEPVPSWGVPVASVEPVSAECRPFAYDCFLTFVFLRPCARLGFCDQPFSVPVIHSFLSRSSAWLRVRVESLRIRLACKSPCISR